ncbi:MAG: hypothetical protein SGJ10_11055 [Bacteroidota bacterium]|nr:hypothetical protein [Bacteroidota bacterium]
MKKNKLHHKTLLLFAMVFLFSTASIYSQTSVYRAKICYRNTSAEMTVVRNTDGSLTVTAVDVSSQSTDKVIHKTISPVTHISNCIHIATTGVTWWIPFDKNRLPEKQVGGGLRDIECPCPSVNTAESCTIHDLGEDLECQTGTCDVCCDGVYGDCGGGGPNPSATMKGAGIFIQAITITYNSVVYQ